MIIQWITEKLLVILAVACAVLLLLLGLQWLQVRHLKLTVAEQKAKIKTSSELIASWQRTTKLANANREKAEATIVSLGKTNDAMRKRIRKANIPADCQGAVEWVRAEAEELAERWNR